MDTYNHGTLDKLTPIRHSLSDWVFQPGKGWHISPTHFVSPPSSLSRPQSYATKGEAWFALGAALGQSIPEGRIITQLRARTSQDSRLFVFFRGQALPVLPLPANCYWFYILETRARLYQRVSDTDTSLIDAPLTFARSLNTWNNWRFTWYLWLDAILTKFLRCIIEAYLAGTWTTQLDFNISTPLWESSPTNRIGFRHLSNEDTPAVWLDDTIIYRRA